MAGPQSLFKAALINILNPAPYIYWSLVTGPILLRGWHETPAFGLAFLFGFYATFVVSLLVIIILFATAGKLGPKVTPRLGGHLGSRTGFLGLYQLWLGISNE